MSPRVTTSAAKGLAYALGTLPPVNRLPAGRVAAAVGLLVGGVTAGVVMAAPAPGPAAEGERADRAESAPSAPSVQAEPTTPLSPARRLGAGVAIGAFVGTLAGGTIWCSLKVDAAAERWLRRRGVGRPRLLMAGAAGVVGGVLEHLDARGDGAPSPDPRPGL